MHAGNTLHQSSEAVKRKQVASCWSISGFRRSPLMEGERPVECESGRSPTASGSISVRG